MCFLLKFYSCICWRSISKPSPGWLSLWCVSTKFLRVFNIHSCNCLLVDFLSFFFLYSKKLLQFFFIFLHMYVYIGSRVVVVVALLITLISVVGLLNHISSNCCCLLPFQFRLFINFFFQIFFFLVTSRQQISISFSYLAVRVLNCCINSYSITNKKKLKIYWT